MTQENCLKLYKHYTETGQTEKALAAATRLADQYGVDVSEEDSKKKGKK